MSDFPIDNLSMEEPLFIGDLEVWIDGKKYYRSLDFSRIDKEGIIRAYPITEPSEEVVFSADGKIQIIKTE